MLLGDMKDMARQIAERPSLPDPLWYDAVRRALGAGRAFDSRLDQLVEQTVTLVAGTTTVSMPAGYSSEQILGVFRLMPNGMYQRLLRWRQTDQPLWQRDSDGDDDDTEGEAASETDEEGEEEFDADTTQPYTMTWDMPTGGVLSFAPSDPSANTTIKLELRFLPTTLADDVPSWALYGALAVLGSTWLQDARAGAWAVQFKQDLESAVAQGITASSMPIRLGGIDARYKRN